MSSFRKYALGEYKGARVSLHDLKLKSERVKLIGKRIGYDLHSSCMLHYGVVTDVVGREIEVNGGLMRVDQFEQIVILDDQGDLP